MATPAPICGGRDRVAIARALGHSIEAFPAAWTDTLRAQHFNSVNMVLKHVRLTTQQLTL